jgi:transposase
MFIRIKTTPNSPRKSIQIVEGYRDKTGKVKQRIVRHVGVALNDDELVRLRDLAEYVKANIEQERQPAFLSPEEMAEMAIKCRAKAKENDEALPIDNIKNLREEQRIVVGIHEVYGAIYKELGFDRVLGTPVRSKTAHDYLRHIVMARIANPQSKRKSVKVLAEDFGIELDLDRVYRMMDKVDKQATTKIQGCALQSTQTLLGGKIDVLFYDATTLYFESFTEDKLKQNGYSKDMKFNQPQVLLALFVTSAGLPIGYETFPGSTYEGHTLITALANLEQRYQINRVVFVADSGLLNEENLALLEAKGHSYIVGGRLRNMARTIQQQILDHESYQEITGGEEEIRVKNITLSDTRKLLINYSPRRAHKDSQDRQKAIGKLMKKMKHSKDPSSLISNYGYKKYIKVSGKSQIALHEEKISQESQWDGLQGMITNIGDLAPPQILEHYKGLWQIEETFRVSKHDLKIRPIFHWTPHRIEAHIAIAFMALTCVRHLEYRVALQQDKMSPEVIRNALSHVQLSVTRHIRTDARYAIPSKSSPEAKKIYQVVGLKLTDTPFAIMKH